MDIERIEEDGITYAEIIRADMNVNQTTFFSKPESSFQFGLLEHRAGFIEPPHYHKPVTRTVTDLQQMFVVQRGKVAVEVYSDKKRLLQEIILSPGDAIVLVRGIHALRVLEDMQCISVKQGPFYGTENDKIIVEIGR